ncbi:MAG: phosphate ABC transporter substrate-binding/OmpA family protein [Pirellulaceae bacterium]|nr:phosphate ABC transporter substrate-binding/OmpA family protein [Pirellulaceae bacterium]
MTKAKIVLAALVWLVILAIGVSFWKLVIEPKQSRTAHQQKQAHEEEALAKTQGTSKYTQEIAIGLDSFSGYALFRSSAFQSLLAERGVRVRLVDDNANYTDRADALETGKLQMALFPADALIKVSAKRESFPATIIAIVDETRGADAMVAYRSQFPNIDSLNKPDAKFVLLADSPSETLARVVMHDFDLRKLGSNPFSNVASPEALLDRYRKATPASQEVFITWEPYVSQLLVNDQLHVLVDSSRFTGYIVDCLAVSRDFLLKNQASVEVILEAYFRALYSFQDEAAFVQLVLDDAKQTKLALTKEQATRLVKGIHWKNTQENFAHMGLRAGSMVHVEDMLARITKILVSTGAIERDPTGGQFNRLFFDQPLASLKTRNFHPGLQSEQVREQAELVALTDEQWKSLVAVGTLSIPELVFARGSATLTEQSRFILDDLAMKLKSWPQYYLHVRGSASNKGDPEANRELASKRASVAVEYLLSLGMSGDRMRSVDGGPSGETRVTFQVVQLPY